MKALEMVRGDTAEWDITVRDPNTKLPKDITGATITMMVKNDYDDADGSAVASVATGGSGITITNGPLGQAHITFPTNATSGLPNDTLNLVYDIQVTSAAGKKWTVERGPFTIRPEVVRA
jgi:hypothetical protein